MVAGFQSYRNDGSGQCFLEFSFRLTSVKSVNILTECSLIVASHARKTVLCKDVADLQAYFNKYTQTTVVGCP